MNRAWNEAETDCLIGLYDMQPLAVDNLPFSEEFEFIYINLIVSARAPRTRREVFHKIINLRKRSKLPRKREEESD